MAEGLLSLDQYEKGSLRSGLFPGHYTYFFLAHLQGAKTCKDALEAQLGIGASPPPTSHASSGIASVNQNQITAQFDCSKDFKQFQLVMPSGYKIASGNVTNSSISFYCVTASDSTSATCSCDNVPKGSTTTAKFTTNPSAQKGMILRFNVTFSDGSTDSFTETTR